ncbi:MAG: PspC domain-containing protein [Bacteroidales bacterium]|nr:MAG: PspC domain-containing protein [Bacteroidales bacterium]
MKKTIKISLGGLTYNIEEDAFILLENYINTLKQRLISDKEGKDIIQDIEERISELFAERKGTAESISIDLVKEVLEILGNPDEIASGAESGNTSSRNYQSQKRLYRDVERSYIAGVCAGLGEYFGADPIVIRIIFIFLIFFKGLGIVLYLILWIAVPKAITPRQKLEMKGEPVNLSNIEKSIREESSQINQNFKKSGLKGFLESIVYIIGRFAYWVIQFLLIIVKVIAIIIAVTLIVTMLIALFAVINVIFFGGLLFHGAFPMVHGIPLGEVITSIFEFSTSIWLTIPIFLVVAIPIFALLYLGIRILFHFKARDRVIGLIAATIWVFSIVIVTFAIYSQAKSFTVRKQVVETFSLESTLKGSQYLRIQATENSESLFLSSPNVIEIDEYAIAKVNGKTLITGRPSIIIERSDKKYPEIEIIRKARGANKLAAELNAKSIKYNYTIKDSILNFDSYFTLPIGEKWKLQELTINLQIPENFKVFIDKSMEDLMNAHQPESDYWPNEMLERKWEMREKKLKELEK